jgi:HEAT repeat protein
MGEKVEKEDLVELVYKYLQGREFEHLQKIVKLGKKAVPVLTKILISNEAGYIRQRAALAIGHIGDTKALDSLGRVLGQDDPALKVAAVRALGMINVAESETLILPLLDTKDASLRKWAIRTLGKIGGKKSDKGLRDRLVIEPEDFLRKEIRKSISKIQ